MYDKRSIVQQKKKKEKKCDETLLKAELNSLLRISKWVEPNIQMTLIDLKLSGMFFQPSELYSVQIYSLFFSRLCFT